MIDVNTYIILGSWLLLLLLHILLWAFNSEMLGLGLEFKILWGIVFTVFSIATFKYIYFHFYNSFNYMSKIFIIYSLITISLYFIHTFLDMQNDYFDSKFINAVVTIILGIFLYSIGYFYGL